MMPMSSRNWRLCVDVFSQVLGGVQTHRQALGSGGEAATDRSLSIS